MSMPVWKTGIVTSRVTTVISAVLLCVSCGPPEQGYWTKQGISQALTTEQYSADSQHCERFAAQNDGRESEKARKKRYTKCMSAHGYQWVVKDSVSLAEQSRSQSSGAHSCPAGSTNCVPGGTKGGGLNPEVNQSITRGDGSHQNPANLPSNPSHQANAPRPVADRECRHQADATMSNSYAVYVNCMQEKGWSSPSAVGATDAAENEKTDSNTGFRLKDIGRGLQSAARNIGDEISTIGSAIGNMFTADSGENEKTDPNQGFTLKDIGRGLQSAARNIGDEIPKIGPAIGNMFKQLGDKDTRDIDKEKASNKLEAPSSKDKK